MKKKFSFLAKVLAIGVILFSMSGCLWVIVGDGLITIQVTNNSGLTIDVWYRDSETNFYGNSGYAVIDNLLPGETKSFTVPNEGTFDLEVTQYDNIWNTYDFDYDQYWYDLNTTVDFSYTYDSTYGITEVY